jgi:putative ATPase
MDLYEYQKNKVLEKESPLASRLRPSKLEDFVGQQHIIGKNTLLYRAIKADKITSIIFYGPPGTGKTSLAKIIANTTKSNFLQINATTSGVKDIKQTIETAKLSISVSGNRTILFVDEIHRFNKSQQDTLLPYVEDGTIILIGATTENPYFEVNKALISRSIIFKLNSLGKEDIKELLNKAISNKDKGLGSFNIKLDDNALNFFADISNGDARVALNGIELASISTDRNELGEIHITLDVAQQCVQQRALNYDKDGDNHYDTISAFIKSMRGSDPDGAVYYMARMLYAGEDPKFIARRIVICASEDVGNADPHALLVAVAAFQATELIGMPECRINLAQAVIYVACAPKSNASYMAINKAVEDVQTIKIEGIPIPLRDSHYKGAKQFGHGKGYKYVHDYDGNYVQQQYLPDELKNKVYYSPTENGIEKKIKERLEHLRNLK